MSEYRKPAPTDFFERLKCGEVPAFNGLTMISPVVEDREQRYFAFTAKPTLPRDEDEAGRNFQLPVAVDTFLYEERGVEVCRMRMPFKNNGSFVVVNTFGERNIEVTAFDPSHEAPPDLGLEYPLTYGTDEAPGAYVSYDREGKVAIDIQDTVTSRDIDDYRTALKYRGRQLLASFHWRESEQPTHKAESFIARSGDSPVDGSDVNLEKYYEIIVKEHGENVMMEVAKKVSGDSILVFAPKQIDINAYYGVLNRDGREWKEAIDNFPVTFRVYK